MAANSDNQSMDPLVNVTNTTDITNTTSTHLSMDSLRRDLALEVEDLGRNHICAKCGVSGVPVAEAQVNQTETKTDHFSHIRHVLPLGLHQRHHQSLEMRHLHVSQRYLSCR